MPLRNAALEDRVVVHFWKKPLRPTIETIFADLQGEFSGVSVLLVSMSSPLSMIDFMSLET